MKVLWFSNTPCGSIRRKDNGASGGWLIALEECIKKTQCIDLEIAFFTKDKESPFVYEGVKYYPIYRGENYRNRLDRLFFRKSQKELDAFAKRQLLQVVEESAPDIIHIHGTEDCFGFVADDVRDIPIVYSIQGLISVYYEKFFSGITIDNIKQAASLKSKILRFTYIDYYKAWKYKGMRERHFLENARYVFGRTFWDECVCRLFNHEVNYMVSDEILRSPFYKKHWHEKSNDGVFTIVSVVSSDSPYKGIETILQSAALLKQYVAFDFKWIVIGYTKITTAAQIAMKIKGINPEDCCVELVGRKYADEMADIMIKAHIYVHVSHIENSSNSICEAMLLGMPVVATFAGGTATILKNNVEGMLVQDGDPYIMAGTIVELHDNWDKAKEMGLNAYKKAIVRHNPERIKNRLIFLYTKIIADFNKRQ